MLELGKQIFQNKDLVLNISPNVNPEKINIDKYEPFIGALCENREYQKQAIREVIRYFLGCEYENLSKLAKENYQNNPMLQGKYASFSDFEKHLQFPDKLACSLDLATGTGKSFVMYGIARIMLAEGAVDKVLVLCPSNTIEDGLTRKFKKLSSDGQLKDLLPKSSAVLNPGIINASQTIKKGDICIENIHATYTMTKSAIEDSLVNEGPRTLILNDEAHHLTSPTNQKLKKWKEFLIDPKYNFRFILNVTGTPYIADDYFTDVVYRFPIKDSMEQKFTKLIRYVAEDTSDSEDEKFQKIYDNHIENKTVKYRKVKPLTILVTKDISVCKRLTERLTKFLAAKEKISIEEASKKVLIVTSANEHKANVAELANVDRASNQIEWITSVSMLTEGWDVKNVFQIVPSEERAFNSKLLIAQVLGRGLRIPDEYKGEQPVVTVFNHDKWSSSIKHLVDEVLEIEKRLHSYPIEKKENYHFELKAIDYRKMEREIEKSFDKEYELRKGFISYSSQARELEKETVYAKALSSDKDKKKTLIEYKMYLVDEVANEVINKLRAIDMDDGTNYSSKYPKEELVRIIRKSLKRIGEKEDIVSQENLQKTLQAVGVFRRKRYKTLIFDREGADLEPIFTKKIPTAGIALSVLKKEGTVFYDDYSLAGSEDEDSKLLSDLIRLKEEGMERSLELVKVENKYCFKTPLNVVLTAFLPERNFARRLIEQENAKVVDSWVKSPDVGFYSLEYSWRKGEHPQKAQHFNPDFFIKIGNEILVIEIKADGDVAPENKGKLRWSRKHFNLLNKLQKEQKYYFKFLSPSSYDHFFKTLREKKYKDFKSEIESAIEGYSNGVKDDTELVAFKNALPLYSLKAAAGKFGDGQEVEYQKLVKVNGRKLTEDMFIAQVVGKSMRPRISDGSYCIFKANPAGTRQGKIVLAQSRSIEDPETGGSYTVKVYESKKKASKESWKHASITLKPLNPSFKLIKLNPEKSDDLKIIAEFINILR